MTRSSEVWQGLLESVPVGAVVADGEHDDWVKVSPDGFTHKEGPLLRAKTLAALWPPFHIVRLPEETP